MDPLYRPRECLPPDRDTVGGLLACSVGKTILADREIRVSKIQTWVKYKS